MIPIRRFFIASVLFGSLLALTGCPGPKPNAPDATPPGFVQVVVRLEVPNDPNLRGEFDITSADVTKAGIGSNIVLRLIATAGDPESAIKNIAIESNLTWRCSAGHGSQIIGAIQNAPLAFPPITPPATPITPYQINVVADPIGQIAQTGCVAAAGGKGPINIGGFVRVVATNGANPALSTTSKTFIYDYANVGSP